MISVARKRANVSKNIGEGNFNGSSDSLLKVLITADQGLYGPQSLKDSVVAFKALNLSLCRIILDI